MQNPLGARVVGMLPGPGGARSAAPPEPSRRDPLSRRELTREPRDRRAAWERETRGDPRAMDPRGPWPEPMRAPTRAPLHVADLKVGGVKERGGASCSPPRTPPSLQDAVEHHTCFPLLFA